MFTCVHILCTGTCSVNAFKLLQMSVSETVCFLFCLFALSPSFIFYLLPVVFCLGPDGSQPEKHLLGSTGVGGEWGGFGRSLAIPQNVYNDTCELWNLLKHKYWLFKRSKTSLSKYYLSSSDLFWFFLNYILGYQSFHEGWNLCNSWSVKILSPSTYMVQAPMQMCGTALLCSRWCLTKRALFLLPLFTHKTSS